MKTKEYIIIGRVQGIGFRWFAKRHAKILRINGWVRNRINGSVEVRAEAPELVLTEFEALLSSGPPGAYVKEMKVTEAEACEGLKGFTIIH